MDKPILNDVEARILGVLIEKAFTTPDQYPLSMNAIRNGCNQKSNRDPVVDFVEAEVVVGLQGLVPKHFAGRVGAAGSRVEKFQHSAKERLGADDGEIAILAELMMRGPQAQGELRARVNRMVPTANLAELQERLDSLMTKGLIERVAPVAGSRATRYGHRLGAGSVTAADSATPAGSAAPSPISAATTTAAPITAAPAGLEARVETLERELRTLRQTVETLIADLG